MQAPSVTVIPANVSTSFRLTRFLGKGWNGPGTVEVSDVNVSRSPKSKIPSLLIKCTPASKPPFKTRSAIKEVRRVRIR